jgi:hypothetical protein
MDTTMTRTSMKKWTKKSKRLKPSKINNNAKLAVLELKLLLVRNKELEMKVVWSLKVKKLKKVSFINTKKEQTYFSNHPIWILTNGQIKLDHYHSRKSNHRGPRNTDNEQLIFLRVTVTQQLRDSPDYQDLELEVPQWLGRQPEACLKIDRNNDHL